MRISGSQMMPILLDKSKCQKVKSLTLKAVSMDPSDFSYTEKRAVERQYMASLGSVSLDDLIHGKAVIKAPDLSKENLAAYEKNLETNGLSHGVNWDAENEISLVGLDGELDEIGDKTDYLASRFAVLKDRIHTDYQGEEQKTQMAKLDELFSKAEKRVADTYAKSVGHFFEECGISGETEKLRNSVLQNYNNRIDEYSAYLQSNRNYASVDSKKDEWLLNDDSYLAQQLRKSMAGNSAGRDTSSTGGPSVKQQAPAYSMRDLEIAGAYSMQAPSCFVMVNPNPSAGRNEEHLGLDLAMQAMKTDYLVKNSGISESMGSLLNHAFEGTMKTCVDACAESLNICANAGFVDGKRLYAPLDKTDVYIVYQITMARYRESGDILGALVDGEHFAEKQYNRKAASPAYNTMSRYKLGNFSFLNFFKPKKQWNPDYDVSLSDFQRYSVSLNYFVKAVNSGNIKCMDFMFGKSGDLSIDNFAPDNLYRYTHNPTLDDIG